MKIGSLFDGSGGFPLAGAMCGFTPAWASEVEPYPIAVTKSRFPTMKHLGNVMKINGAEIEPVDVLTFGFPCQDVSVAGKRAGIKHEDNGDDETTRSGLVWEAVRIIKEMRCATNGKYPSFAVFENVPGLFSAEKGETFRTVIEGLIKIVEPNAVMPEVPTNGWAYADSYIGNGWSFAYRIFDAQYIRTAQRRRRVYAVLDLGGQRARQILFEREGLRGYFAEGGTPWQAAPADAQGSVGADDREGERASEESRLGVGGVPESGGTSGRDGRGQLDDVSAYGIDHAITTGGNCTAQGSCIYEDIQATLKASGVHAVAYTLKIRSRCEGGGKGALIQEDKSATLATNNDQYLFQPVEPTAIIDNVGGQAEYAKAPKVNGMLRAGAQGLVAYAVENHPADSRVNIDESGKRQTLTSRMGTGGGNVPMVMEQTPFCKSGRARSADDATTWKHGKVANTLNTFDQGEARVNELIVTLEGNGQRPSHNGNGYAEIDKSYTLNATEVHGVAYEHPVAIDRAFFNQGQNALYEPQTYEDGTNPTLVAKGPSAVAYSIGNGQVHDAMSPSKEVSKTLNCLVDPMKVLIDKPPRYIVRRLTPTECARLQGFPDRWGDIEPKAEFTDEEYLFWLDVRNTHAEINGRAVKDYTEKQMLTWYNKLHTDSAEYKLWGNGIALPCALYVMQGIADVINK